MTWWQQLIVDNSAELVAGALAIAGALMGVCLGHYLAARGRLIVRCQDARISFHGRQDAAGGPLVDREPVDGFTGAEISGTLIVFNERGIGDGLRELAIVLEATGSEGPICAKPRDLDSAGERQVPPPLTYIACPPREFVEVRWALGVSVQDAKRLRTAGRLGLQAKKANGKWRVRRFPLGRFTHDEQAMSGYEFEPD